MTRQEFRDRFFPISEVIEDAKKAVETVKQNVADHLGGDVDDFAPVVDNILDALDLDIRTNAGAYRLAQYRNADDHIDLLDDVIAGIDLI